MKFPETSGNKNSSSSGGGNYVKMQDGDKLKGVFRGDPYIFHLHWVGKRSKVCTYKSCKLCEDGIEAKFRFAINFITQENGIWVAKVFEQGYGTFKDLKEMHEDSYNLEETYVTVTRSGEGTDTRYRIMPLKMNLTPADFKKVAAIPLIKLNDKEDAPPEAAPSNDDDIAL